MCGEDELYMSCLPDVVHFVSKGNLTSSDMALDRHR